jgi:hypothetical protein
MKSSESPNPEEWNESFRKAIIKKIKELEEKLEAKELSFNGFMIIAINFFLFI